MGCPGAAVLLRVELPLAVPLIAAGFRTAAVQVVATATLAALVGGGGLGVIINSGFGQQDRGQIVAGGILVAALALVAELMLAFVQRQVTPGRARGRLAGPAWTRPTRRTIKERGADPVRSGRRGARRLRFVTRGRLRLSYPRVGVGPNERVTPLGPPDTRSGGRRCGTQKAGTMRIAPWARSARPGCSSPSPSLPAATAVPPAPRPHRRSPAARPAAAQACEADGRRPAGGPRGRQEAADRRQHHPGGQRRRRDAAAARRAQQGVGRARHRRS